MNLKTWQRNDYRVLDRRSTEPQDVEVVRARTEAEGKLVSQVIRTDAEVAVAVGLRTRWKPKGRRRQGSGPQGQSRCERRTAPLKQTARTTG